MKIRNLLILLIFSIYLTTTTDAFAKEVYAFIKSKNLKQINQIINGYKGSFPGAKMVFLDLKGRKNPGKVKAFIRRTKPSVIICLGSLATKTTMRVEKKIPIIFTMVINYKRHKIHNVSNVTGVSMEIPALMLFTQFKMLMPSISSIGAPYHPQVSSEIIKDAKGASKLMNIKLVTIKVTDPDDIEDKLEERAKKFQGLWMLADTKLYNRKTEALDDLIEFAEDNKKPLLAFSEAFLKSGAFFSISIDYKSLGSQIAALSRRIVQDKVSPRRIPVALPIGTFTVINREVAKEILEETMSGEELDEALEGLYENVDKIYPELEEDD
ncbi:MAG: hypothetical protein GY754_01840 [bacterium]|nr:hypothetical protein [bacterium]